MEIPKTIDYYIRYDVCERCIYLWNTNNTPDNLWIISEKSIRNEYAEHVFSAGALKVPEPLYSSINEMIWNFFQELTMKVQNDGIDNLPCDTRNSPIKFLEINGSYRTFMVQNDKFFFLSELCDNGGCSFHASSKSPCCDDDAWEEGWEDFKANDFHYTEGTSPEYIIDEVLYYATNRINKLYKLLLSIIDLLKNNQQ